MNQIDTNIILMITLVLINIFTIFQGLLKHRKVREEKHLIIFSFNLEGRKILLRVLLVILGIWSIIYLFFYSHITAKDIICVSPILLCIVSSAVITNRIVLTKSGLAYASFSLAPYVFLEWNNILNYYIFDSNRGNKIKIIIEYYDYKGKPKKLKVGINKEDREKVVDKFKEFIIRV